MIGVQLALEVWGYSRVVVVGVHLEGHYAGYRSAWKPLASTYGRRIRAIGGYTQKLFSLPDAAFAREL